MEKNFNPSSNLAPLFCNKHNLQIKYVSREPHHSSNPLLCQKCVLEYKKSNRSLELEEISGLISSDTCKRVEKTLDELCDSISKVNNRIAQESCQKIELLSHDLLQVKNELEDNDSLGFSAPSWKPKEQVTLRIEQEEAIKNIEKISSKLFSSDPSVQDDKLILEYLQSYLRLNNVNERIAHYVTCKAQKSERSPSLQNEGQLSTEAIKKTQSFFELRVTDFIEDFKESSQNLKLESKFPSLTRSIPSSQQKTPSNSLKVSNQSKMEVERSGSLDIKAPVSKPQTTKSRRRRAIQLLDDDSDLSYHSPKNSTPYKTEPTYNSTNEIKDSKYSESDIMSDIMSNKRSTTIKSKWLDSKLRSDSPLSPSDMTSIKQSGGPIKFSDNNFDFDTKSAAESMADIQNSQPTHNGLYVVLERQCSNLLL